MIKAPTDIVTVDLKGNLLFSIPPEYQRQFMISSWNRGMEFYTKTEGYGLKNILIQD